jgi:hypothetical protein
MINLCLLNKGQISDSSFILELNTWCSIVGRLERDKWAVFSCSTELSEAHAHFCSTLHFVRSFTRASFVYDSTAL